MISKPRCITVILFLLIAQFAVFVVLVQRKHGESKSLRPVLEHVGGRYNTARLRYAFHGMLEQRKVKNGVRTSNPSSNSPNKGNGRISVKLEPRIHGNIKRPSPSSLAQTKGNHQHQFIEKPVDGSNSPSNMNKIPHQQTSTVDILSINEKKKTHHFLEELLGPFEGSPALEENPGVSDSTTLMSVPSITWKEGSFCEDFLTKTFKLRAPVCSVPGDFRLQEAVECFGSPYSSSMGTCTLRNIVVTPNTLMQVMYDPDRPKFEEHRHSISLLRGLDTECKGMTITNISERMEGGDYVFKVVKNIMLEDTTRDVTVCDAWVNETVFFFTAHRFHIFFRFLDYYNVHKLVGEFEDSNGSGFRIIRISGSDNYHFPEFDRALFPEAKVQALEDLGNVTTCFKKVVLVPKSYASPIFQCKNRVSLRSKCYDCDGKGLNETDISKFSKRVLNACSSSGKLPSKGEKQLLVVVSRTPYLRNQNDEFSHFERVMENEDELITALQKALPNATVSLVHLENLTICEQISYGRNADVYLGVHGSGLVHLWWMRDDAVLYELEPHYQIGNPTFRMLATLAGRRYHNDIITGSLKFVRSDVGGVVKDIRQYL